MPEPFPVALCITELEVGGAEKAITELAIHLDRSRFTPVVYSLRSHEFHAGRPSYLAALESADVPVRFLDIGGVVSLPGAIFRLRRMLREQKPVVFQSFLAHANLIGRFAARGAKVPVVCSGIRVSEKGRTFHLFLDRLTGKWVDSWVCVSRSVAEFSETTGGLPKNRLTVIPNAVSDVRLPVSGQVSQEKNSPCSLFSQKESSSQKNAVVIGRLTYQKGLDWLLATMPEWLGTEKYKDWSIWIIGSGELGAQLRELGAKLPPEVAKRVHFAGWCQDIPKILAESDLLILASRWEGMPNVVLEAMLAAKPVLATRSDGVVEMIGDEWGLEQTCDFGDTDGFLEKLRPLLADASLREKLGTANAARVRKEFSVEQMVTRYQNHWLELLNTCGTNRACGTNGRKKSG